MDAENEAYEKCESCSNTSEEFTILSCEQCNKKFCCDCSDDCGACEVRICRKCQEGTKTFSCGRCLAFRCSSCRKPHDPLIKTCRHCGSEYCATTCWGVQTCMECNRQVGCSLCHFDQNSQCLSCFKAECTATDFIQGLHPDFFSPDCPFEVFRLIKTYIHT